MPLDSINHPATVPRASTVQVELNWPHLNQRWLAGIRARLASIAQPVLPRHCPAHLAPIHWALAAYRNRIVACVRLVSIVPSAVAVRHRSVVLAIIAYSMQPRVCQWMV